MSSFWKNNGKIQVSQTQVAIPSTNGRSYSGTAGISGKRIDFDIPPSVKFMDGKNSYLNFDIKLALPDGGSPTRIHLDPSIGGQSIIKNIRFYTGDRAVLLEELVDYNGEVQMEYSYNQDDSLRKMRALKEGCLINNIENRGTLGTSVSNNIDIITNPYYKPVSVVPVGRDWGTSDDFLTCKCSLPIHMGLFARGGDKIFPAMLTKGIVCEIDIEDPARIIKTLDSVNRNRRVKQNPIFHGEDAAGTGIPADGSNITEIFLGKQNNMISVANCPFVKGEPIGMVQLSTNKVANFTTTSDVAVHPVITDIELDGSGYVKLTIGGTFRNDGTAGVSAALVSNQWALYSAALDTKTENYTTGAQILAKKTVYAATMELSNVEMVIQKVEVDPQYEAGMMKRMREGGSIEIDIPSVTNYKHSLLASNRNATINLAVSNTRAKSLLVMPVDSDIYDSADLIGALNTTYEEETTTMDGKLHSNKSGQVGCIDYLSTWQMVIDDKNCPSRPINVSKINKGTSISAQPLHLLEQALSQAGITPNSFVDYNRNFVIGKAYALNDGVSNLNNKSNQLQLFYNESSVAGVDRPPVKQKMLHCYMYHLRRITMKNGSVSVTL
tara:strand:+ start:3144 stop:4973 length:1830 start_codon:yes stop_codon:yes gene_type:complete